MVQGPYHNFRQRNLPLKPGPRVVINSIAFAIFKAITIIQIFKLQSILNRIFFNLQANMQSQKSPSGQNSKKQSAESPHTPPAHQIANCQNLENDNTPSPIKNSRNEKTEENTQLEKEELSLEPKNKKTSADEKIYEFTLNIQEEQNELALKTAPRLRNNSIQVSPNEFEFLKKEGRNNKPASVDHNMTERQLEDDMIELPLQSTVSFGQRSNRYAFCSSGSDTSEPKTSKSKNKIQDDLSVPSFQSEEGQELDMGAKKCQLCQTLQRSNQKYEIQNNEYVSEIIFLRNQNHQLRRSTKHADIFVQVSDDSQDQSVKDNPLSKKLIKHIKSLHEGLGMIKANSFQEIITFSDHEEDLIPEVIKGLKYLLKVIDKQEKLQSTQKMIKLLHQKYRLIIDEIKRSYEDKLTKYNSDMKIFIETIKSSEQNKRKFNPKDNPSKQDTEKKRCQKKSISLNLSTEQFLAHSEVNELKEKIDSLEWSYKEEKKKSKGLETINKALIQKYSKQLPELGKQKTQLFNRIKRYEAQFQMFMQKMSHNSSLTSNLGRQFFNGISKRIFQISNCIPFEENDEQNLFAPDNEVELLDMIERIRRFSLTIQDFTSQKDLREVNLKKHVVSLFKSLVEAEKVSLKFVLKLIRNNEEWQMDYLKQYLLHLQQKRTKQDLQKTQLIQWSTKKKRTLSLSKIQPFTLKFGNFRDQK